MSSMETEIFQTDIVQGDIRYRDSDHTYLHVPTKKSLTPVTKVINTVFSTKSWDGVDPAVIENARLRGIAIDRYMTQYVRESRITIALNESRDVAERVVAAHRIWEEEFSGLKAEAQKIVYDVNDGIAGTMDFWIDDRIVADLKATYSVEKSWILQIGAYAFMAPKFPERAGIIHVNKDGGTWMEYDVEACARYWHKAIQWWKETNGMAKEVKVSRKKD